MGVSQASDGRRMVPCLGVERRIHTWRWRSGTTLCTQYSVSVSGSRTRVHSLRGHMQTTMPYNAGLPGEAVVVMLTVWAGVVVRAGGLRRSQVRRTGCRAAPLSAASAPCQSVLQSLRRAHSHTAMPPLGSLPQAALVGQRRTLRRQRHRVTLLGAHHEG